MPIARINNKILHFVHIPKTGGSSVSRYLRRKGDLALYAWSPLPWAQTTPQHMQRSVHEALVPRGFCDAAFTILRDPVARMVSEYRYRAARLRTAHGSANAIEWHDGSAFRGTFEAWVRVVIEAYATDPYIYDNHIRPQSEYWCEGLKTFFLEDGLEHVFDWIDAETETDRDGDPVHENRGARVPCVVSQELRGEIEAFYAADLELIRTVRLREAAAFAGAQAAWRDAPRTAAE